MPHYIIDRFENGAWAVLEDEQSAIIRVPMSWIPEGAHEGDVLTGSVSESAGGERIPLEIDAVATEERRARAQRLRNGLQRGPKGDISL